jgi:tetratricopeptide (TPR) repeat protein
VKRILLIQILALASLSAADAPQTFTVKEDNYPLRSGCSDSAEPIAALKKGDVVKIRYALAESGGPCYAVAVEVNGTRLQGYVQAGGLTGLEEFERRRRSASSAARAGISLTGRPEVQAVRDRAAEQEKTGKVDFALAAQLNLAADALQSGRPGDAESILARLHAPKGQREAAMLRGIALLQLNQPDRAMDILAPALRENKKDAQLLKLAGNAAYQMDDLSGALHYWKESLDLRPDPQVEQMCKKLEREMGADKSGQKTYGMRFLLRYDTAVAGPDLARSMVAALEEEFSRISFQLGCPAEERIIVIVQSRDDYFRSTGAAEWSGGLYDGKIRIPLAPSKQIDAETRRTFAHEIVHACMSSIARWPGWLQEGMAQKLSGETVRPAQRDVLKALARAGKLPKLDDLGNGWGSLNATQASVAYTLALAAVEIFCDKYGSTGPRNLMNNPQSLLQITPQLDRELQEALKN